MIKLILTAIAALSIFASPVLATPWDQAPTNSYNYSGDFQLQGR